MNGVLSDPSLAAPACSRKADCCARQNNGMTLIELLVAMTLGSFLMIGAITVFTQGQSAFRVSDSISRLQENARLALALLESDIRMAGYFGLSNRPGNIENRTSPVQPIPPGLAVRNDCGQNWAINLDAPVGGTNNGFGWDRCTPYEQPQPDSDTLVVRRTSATWTMPDDLRSGTLYVQSGRFGNGFIFSGDSLPPDTTPPSMSRSYQLVARGYYASRNSSLDTPGNPVPSLRVKTLAGSSLGPRIVDQEIVPGVEDLQVQFGVDTDRIGEAGWGSVNRYLNPGAPALDPADPEFLPEARVLAVRIWLRMRSEQPEQGYLDATEYSYADQERVTANDRFRRAMVEKTIQLRNAGSTF